MTTPPASPPIEFFGATALKGPHRFCITLDGTIHFGLLGEDGAVRYFKCSADIADRIAVECTALAEGARKAVKSEVDPLGLSFPTAAVYTIIPKGNNTNGAVQFCFHTDTGTILSTMISAELASQMASQLVHLLSTMPNPPRPSDYSKLQSQLPGSPYKGNAKTAVYYGQEYRTDILQIIGVLIIRANLLEKSLVRLLATLLEISEARSDAIFYSSQNAKARSDMIRASLEQAKLNEALTEGIAGTIERVDSISRRRNLLVHGEWEFKGDKFVVREKKPLLKSSTERIETLKAIEALATEYHDTAVIIDLQIEDVARVRNIAK
jgi:hypothetical protein